MITIINKYPIAFNELTQWVEARNFLKAKKYKYKKKLLIKNIYDTSPNELYEESTSPSAYEMVPRKLLQEI